MKQVLDVLRGGGAFTRPQLENLTGMTDRAIRNEIHRLRRDGVPIIGLPSGGYKLATTDEEKAQMLHQLKGRALDLLRTHSLMAKALQVDGQVSMSEIFDALEVGA